MKDSYSKEMTLESPHDEKVYTQKNCIDLEKELVLFKEKTCEILQKYNRLFELLEEEVEKKKNLQQQLKSSHETISRLEAKIKQLEDYNKRIERKLRALENSKLGRLTKKYWAFRKRIVKGVKSQ
jgi:septal ring factor EnvC (AmiA/AmiB activator)